MISKRLIFFHLLVLAVLLGCSFFNAIHGSFKMDDHDFFKDPKIINSKYFKYNWIPEANRYLKLSVSSEESSYRPITNATLSLLYHRFGYHVEYYHLFSLFLFALGSCLLYVFVILLCGNATMAFLSAALFIVHPVNGLAVNYVVAYAYAYQLVFTMTSMICFILAFKLKNAWAMVFLSLFFFVLSLGVHETSLVLPVYLAGIAWIMCQGNIKKAVVKTIPFFIVLAAFLFFRLKYASLKTGVLEKFADFHMSVFQFLATFTKLIAWYFSQLILPDGIVLMWSSQIVNKYVWLWLMLLIVLFGVVILFVQKWGRSIQSWACLCLSVGFIPILGACLFRPTTGLVMEPHWMFFSSIGFFILYAMLLVRVIEWNKWIGIFLVVVLLSGFMKLTQIYNDLWSDEKTYCYYWLEKVPSFKTTEFFLAYAFIQEKKYDQARSFLLDAREGIYSDWQIYGNLGVMDYEQGNFDRAYGHYIKALEFNPNSGEIYNNIALVLEKSGQIEQAVKANTKALQLNSFMLEPRLNLARISLTKNDVDGAIMLYRKNLEIVPYDDRTIQLLFSTLTDAGKINEAEILIRDLISHASNADLLTKMAVLAAEKKQVLWALDLYMQALRINPEHKETYVQAGVLLANLRQLDRAIEMWQQALRLDANDLEVKALIKKAKANKEKVNDANYK
jgi:tetratricopeptide (TPR) repeat protein